MRGPNKFGTRARAGSPTNPRPPEGGSAVPKLGDNVRAAVRAGGMVGDVPTFVPDGTPHPANSPRDERGRLRGDSGNVGYYTSMLKQLAKEPTDIVHAALHDAGITWPRPTKTRFSPTLGKEIVHENPSVRVTGHGKHVVLIGDIVTGFEAYGPFDSVHDAITWKSSTGVREFAHGQWFLMELKAPIQGRD